MPSETVDVVVPAPTWRGAGLGLRDEAARVRLGYGRLMNRVKHLAREYWFELLMAVMAVAAVLELVIGAGSPGAPTTSLRVSVPLIAALVVPLFGHRRFPFAAPVAYWLIAAALSFV